MPAPRGQRRNPRPPKTYPLLILQSELEDGSTVFWSKGHHEPQDFATEVLFAANVEVDPSFVHHAYWRWATDFRTNRRYLIDAEPGVKATFPVTYHDA